MAVRTYDKKQAELLAKEHKDLLERLEQTAAGESRRREEVRHLAKQLSVSVLQETLKTIKVDELYREGTSLRIKALTDAGITTIADLQELSASALSSIPGIGEESAQAIRRAADTVIQAAWKTTRIRLSADHRNRAYTELILAVCRFRREDAAKEEAAQLLEGCAPLIRQALSELAGSDGNFASFGLFRSGEKQRQHRAFSVLDFYLDSSYKERAEEALRLRKEADTVTEEEAWAEFVRDPVSFTTVLEQLSPAFFPGESTPSGLPSGLADAIRKEPLDEKGLLTDLRAYQRMGVRFILHQKQVLLGDEMGLSKTVQAIAAMVTLSNIGEKHFLVVCPAAVITNWCREIRRYCSIPIVRLIGPDRQEACYDWIKTGGIAITSYDMASTLNFKAHFRCALLVADEAHYLKNEKTLRSQGVNRLGRKADRILFMTGTPLENRVDEMVTLIRMLRPDIASDLRGLEGLASAPQFREVVSPVYYRRKRDEVLTELPELQIIPDWSSLTPEETQAYKQALSQGTYAEARRVSWNVPAPASSTKAARLLSIAADAAEDGRKVIAFSFFLDTLSLLKDLLGDRALGPITGSLSGPARQALVDRFEEAQPGTVLLSQIEAGGTGLNIQAASVVILCEPQLKPSLESQAISRAYRMGQTRDVLVYRLLCEDCIDEEIVRRLDAKTQIFNAFADASEAAKNEEQEAALSLREIVEQEKARLGLS